MLSGSFTCYAQPEFSTKSKKAVALFQEAEKAYNLLEYDNALSLLDQAIAKDKNFIEAYLLQAQMYNELHKFEQETERYNRVLEINQDFSPRVWSLKGQACLRTGQYEVAKKLFEKYLNEPSLSDKLRQVTKKRIESADFGIYSMEHPVPFKPVNLGKNINSYLNEYWPSLTADEQTMVITREIPKPGISPDAPVSQLTHQEDLYVSYWENGEWSRTYNIGPEINTEQYNEGTQAFSVDGQYLFYTVCNKPGDYGRCDIYYSRKIDDKWTLPENIGPPVSTSAWESHPSFSSDGKTLYFTSNRAGGRGEMDIWTVVLQEDGSWSKPVNLGDSINTPGFEMSPFIHPDNQTLYFASDGHTGMGGMDIYYSRKNTDGTWSKPVNMGYPINTWADEHGLIVNAGGNLAYFASDRFGEKRRDIFQFELYENARPVKVTYVKGRIYDARTMKGLEADIELTELEADTLVAEANSDEANGKYLVCLPSERNYAFNIFKKGYMFHSENFSLKNLEDTLSPYIMDFGLHPIDDKGTIILKNVFFETDSYELKPESKTELNKLVRFLDENPGIRGEIGGHTDSVGTKKYNDELSLNRAKAVYDFVVSGQVDPARLTYKGYGFSKPIATNATPEGRAQNRRTEFRIVEPGK
ncbi:MAG: OmpA family protein [Bacteroidetes bacterium]|nr:OmpA family protein [Bacteroidota bacterium]